METFIGESLLYVCLVGMLLSSLLLVGRMRLQSFLAMFRLQSLFLSIYAFSLAYLGNEPSLMLMAILVFAVKVVLVPHLLLRAARRSGASLRLSAFLRPAALLFMGALITLFSFTVAGKLLPLSGFASFVGASALSLLLLGLFLLISRKDLFGGSIGFLVMENGIFIFGLALVGGMPFFVEIGILFDVMVSFVLMLALTFRVQREHASVETEKLSELVG